jgi:tetratricopeptide (TPR) repeat protein
MKKASFFNKVSFFSVMLFLIVIFLFPPSSHAQSPKEERDRANALYKDAREKYNRSDFHGAVRQLEETLTIFKKLGKKPAATIGLLGDCYRSLGDYRKAIAYYEQALAIDDETGDRKGKGYRLGALGAAYNSLGDYRKAFAYYEQALAIADEIGDRKVKGYRLGGLGDSYYGLGDYQKAIANFEQALAIDDEIGDRKGKGYRLGALGTAYNSLGDYRKAIAYYEQALAIADEIGDRKGKRDRLGRLGYAYNSLGDYRKAIAYFEQSLAIYEEIPNKPGKVYVLGALGNAYNSLGDYRKATTYYEQALAIVQEIGDKKGKGNCLGALGTAYNSLGDYLAAIAYYEQALVIYEEIPNKPGKVYVLGGLGNAYNSLGDYRKAIAYCEQALAIAQEIGDKKGKGNCLSSLGNAYNSLGDYRKAIAYYEQSLAIAEEIGDKRGKGNNLGNLGIAYYSLVDYRKTIVYLEQALAIAEEVEDRKSKGAWLSHLGNAYNSLGDYRKAIAYYEQALAIAEEIGNKRGKGNNLGNLGIAYYSLGDYRKTIAYYEKALAIAEEIEDRKGKGHWLSHLGIAYYSLGDYRNAIAYHEKAIAGYKEIGVPYGLPEGNLGDAYLAQDRNDEAFAIYTKQNHPIRLGRFYLKKKDFQKAKEQFDRNRESDERRKAAGVIISRWIGLGLSHEGLKEHDRAYGWYTKAIDFMEEQRAALTPAEREHYFEGSEFDFPRIEAYKGAARCAFQLGKFEDAFYWAENTRGRVLSELLSRRHAGEHYKIPSLLAREEEELATAIMINKKQQQTAFQQNNPQLLKQAEAEYPTLKQKMENIIDRLRKEYPQYASIKYPQPVKLSQISLKKGETIIEYEVTDPYTIGLVIRDGSVIKAFKVDKTRTELEAIVSKFRAPFQEGANMNEFSLNIAKDLSDLLIKPALPVLKKGERLIIIPNESLSLLPFESLLLSAPVETLREEAVLLAQATKQTAKGTIDKATIIRGLTKVPVTRSRGVYVAPRITTHILFDAGSAQIKNESETQLKEIASALASKELKNAAIQIEGHTDSGGDPKYNMKLSLKRAQAVYDYMAKSGIREDRLTYTGKGDTKPIADNKDDAGKRLNRRVDFVRTDSRGVERASSSSQITDFVYAIDEYPISYYQSASVLTLQRGLHINRIKEQNFFGLGDPVFDAKDERVSDKRAVKIIAKKTGISSYDIADNEETKDAGYSFSRLVNTAKEVKEVGKLFNKSKLLLGLDASKEKLKQEDLTSRKYVLFSTHGILGNEIPYIKQPALVLSLVGNVKEDGFLTASEIFNMDLNADIVGLSACKTGLGVQSAGEGVVGLSRAFMYAGTDTVLVSLWSVADESTYKLMVKFFDGLRSGKDKMTALKEAKDHLRKNGYDNPFYWAPFILMGEAN